MVECAVCHKVEQKYKCPACKTPYCSLNCYKDHKKDCQEILNQINKDNPEFCIDNQPATNTNLEGLYIEDEDDEEIPLETLAKLGESENLKQLLQNPHLRDFLSHVNGTHNPKGFMKFAMREPLFVEFADACLKVLHPELKEGEEVTDEQIVEHIKEQIKMNQE